MIDLHCHLLPAIDDGAGDLEEALALASAAAADGITHAVITPHIHLGRYTNTRASIRKACEEFRVSLERQQIPLQLSCAAEVRICGQLPRLVVDEELPFLGSWESHRVLLLEMPHSHVPVGMKQLVTWLLSRNIRPMIAHPERNRDILRNYDGVRELVQLGCLLQVTAASLTGGFGDTAQLRAEQMLREGLVTVLATDAHNTSRRPPLLSAGREAAEQIVGESSSWDLVWNNPLVIAAQHFPKAEQRAACL
ncbi:tyrosine-protein phosphatase [Microbulbifer magnicolonia]|uniref:tyrosine-protein phosphatase n=1 Tax=Microbulbifer magnicolonia TaxID=3109744 RepID=UPI002B411108|nr:CpsB/CapC family capsule biosynthesis tyrosine phosphatase [Microbulbifer sp. GG15]